MRRVPCDGMYGVPFLRGAIDVARNELAMPMELFWDSRFVVNIDHDPAPFP